MLSQNPSAQLACRVAEKIYSLLMEWMQWLLQADAIFLSQEYSLLWKKKIQVQIEQM